MKVCDAAVMVTEDVTSNPCAFHLEVTTTRKPSCYASQVYRQCPAKGCGHEIGFCKSHGGDERAQQEMIHIAKHHPPVIED